MRTIERETSFKKDYKRELKGQNKKIIEIDFPIILNLLVNDLPLDQKYSDHPLKGDWMGYRDCHIKSLVLVYKKEGQHILRLARLGSHSELDF